MKKAIINKILYTVGNDLALFCLLVAVYYLPRIIPYNLVLILLLIVFLVAVFCFYLVRAFTVIGDIYDEDYNTVYVLLKLIFLFLNLFALYVFFALLVISFVILGFISIIITWAHYY